MGPSVDDTASQVDWVAKQTTPTGDRRFRFFRSEPLAESFSLIL